MQSESDLSDKQYSKNISGLHLESEESEYLAHQFYQLARLESNSQGMLTPNLKMTSDLAKVTTVLDSYQSCSR